MTDKKPVLTIQVYEVDGGFRAELVGDTPYGPVRRYGWPGPHPSAEAAAKDAMQSLSNLAAWRGSSYRNAGRRPHGLGPAQFLVAGA